MREVQILFAAVMAFILMLLAAMYFYPKYKVYSRNMHGQAVLAEAEHSRKVAIEEARAKKESAIFEAEAEIIRAEGVAKANAIVANGLGGAEGYLRYLAIDAMKTQSQNGNSTIYVATEAGIPITEAARFNKPIE